MTKMWIAILLSGSIFTACSDDDTANEGVALAGAWTSSCFATGDGTFAQLAFDIGAADWAVDYAVHGTTGCDSPLVTVHIDGPYAVEGASAAVAGAYEGRFGFRDKTIRPHVSSIVEALDAAGCGTGAWSVDSPQSVAAGCAPFGQHPIADCSADYDLVARQGDTLRFGKRPADNDMCTPERRPTELGDVALTPRP